MIQTSPVKNPSAFKNDYHWHIEVMPRLTRVAGFERGTGFYICPIPPEMTASFLREVDIHA
jgi:UDPglucose--hexose-1-phosphate uridylyltransferase